MIWVGREGSAPELRGGAKCGGKLCLCGREEGPTGVPLLVRIPRIVMGTELGLDL